MIGEFIQECTIMSATMVNTESAPDHRTGEYVTDACERLDVLAAKLAGTGCPQAEGWAHIVFATVRGKARLDVCRATLRADQDPVIPACLRKFLDMRQDPVTGARAIHLTAAGLWWLAEEVWRRRVAVL
jgi:hypothetical protein